MTLNNFIDFERKWEGGLSRHTSDSASKNPCPTPFKGKSGWHTNAGITYSVWCKKFGKTNDQRFFEMSNEDWFAVFDSLYYSKVKAGSFNSLSIGFMVTTIAWGSGARQAGLTLQRAINKKGGNVSVDGAIGPKTLAAANAIPPQELFDELVKQRADFFQRIAKGKNAVFLKGWMNRLNAFVKEFKP
ncbi:putative peptidoglycan-binding domain-containing protein [Fluviicola sp.]|jgi:lysozyme family protein|uniref:putative peptidoglycan-binding domain-containing protein n=1 Tax=Fluviicola sp. TaxID=1917219 RepID=UPI00262C4640|nr:putative peptidoglycan-binding domain-containing protein [Fluviicola sp.]